MSSVPDSGDLSLRLPPEPVAARLSRVFVSGVLDTLGLDGPLVEDAKVVVSDLVTGLVVSGREVELAVHLEPGSVSIEGETAEEVPPTVALLGDSVSTGGGRWRIHLRLA